MEIRITKVLAEKDERGCTHIKIKYKATHGEFIHEGETNLDVWGTSYQNAEVKLIYQMIVSDVWWSFKDWLRKEQINDELLSKLPTIKKLKGKRIPESYFLARELEK